MGFPATVRNTPTNIGRVLSGQVVVNQGGDTVYLGTSPGEVAQGVQSGVPLFAASALIWNSSGYLWAACPANTNPIIQIQEDGGIPFAAPFVSGEQIQPSGLRSLGFVTGVSGWRLDKAGNVEFNSGVFRGNVVVGPAAGNRIEINVISGVIDMYDAANALSGRWNANTQSFTMYKSGSGRQSYVSIDATNGLIRMQPNGAVYVTDGTFESDTVAVDGGVARSIMRSPYSAGGEASNFRLAGRSVNGTVKPVASLDNGLTATQTGNIRVDGAWNLLPLAAGFQSAAVLATSFDPAYRYVTPNRIELRGAWQPNPAGLIVAPASFVTALPAAITPVGIIQYFSSGCTVTASTVNGRTSVRGTSSSLQFHFVGANAPTWASLDGISYDLT